MGLITRSVLNTKLSSVAYSFHIGNIIRGLVQQPSAVGDKMVAKRVKYHSYIYLTSEFEPSPLEVRSGTMRQTGASRLTQ